MEEKNTQNQRVAESAKNLWLLFERDFDPGLFESMTRNHPVGKALPAGWRNLGEGADQTALGRICGQVDYSLSIPKPSFLERLGHEGRHWLASLDRLRLEARRRAFEGGPPTLVPPMQISMKPAAIIMPVGSLISSLPAEFAGHLAATLKQLADLGLELDDAPQLAVWHGLPFIYDWSDLRVSQAGRKDLFR